MASHAISETAVSGHAVRLLRSPAGVEAVFAPGVGMIGCSLRHAGAELLGQGGGLRKYAESGSTMGIPLLHPWANRLDGLHYEVDGSAVHLDPERTPVRFDGNGLPIHGLAAASPYWEVTRAQADDATATLSARLPFADHPDLLAGFPFPHELRVEVRLAGEVLDLETTLHATGDVAVPVAFGYHPYLRLPAESRSTVEIEVPVPTRLVLDERQIPTGERVRAAISPGPLAERTFDDGFADVTDGTTFVVRGSGRTISVTFLEGYHFAQVYAPSESEFICYEPMTAPTNALTSGDSLTRVRPGDAYSAAFRISVG